MLLLTPVLIAIAVALARGGSLRYLATLPVRGGGLIVASVALQLLLSVSTLRSAPFVVRWNGVIYLLVISLALVGALRNWHLGVAARVAIAGVVLNMTVIVLNGGHMPVSVAAMRAVQGDARVRAIGAARSFNNTRLADRSSRLAALSDVIPVRVLGSYGNVYSVGDLLLAGGLATLVYRATRRPYRTLPGPPPAS